MSHVVLLLCLSLMCHSRLVNVTVDDYPGAVPTGATLTYAPDGDWLPEPTAGDDSKIDYSRVHGGTLHTGPWPEGNLTLTFVGTRIYLFFVLEVGWNNDLFFYLDGATQPSGRFFRPGDESIDIFLYNQLVHRSDTLPMGKHSLRVDVSNIPRIYFDFAVFTTEEGGVSNGATPSRASTNAPPGGPSSAPLSGTPVGPTSGTSLPDAGPPSGPPGTPEVGPQSGTSPSRTTTDPETQVQTGQTSDDATAVHTSRNSSDAGSSTHSSAVNLPAAVGASVAGAIVVAMLCSYIIWRRRRRSKLALLVPLDAPPVSQVPTETAFRRREGAGNVDREETSPAVAHVPLRENKFRRQWEGASYPVPPAPPSASSVYSQSEPDIIRAELERVRGENERVLSEMAVLRQAGTAPPPYSDVRQSEHSDYSITV